MSVKSNNFFKYIFHRASKIYLLIFFLMAAMLFSSFCSIEILRRLIELAISPNVNFHDVIKYIALYISVIIFNFAVSMVSEYFSSIAVKNDIIKSQIDSYEKILKRNNLSSLQYSADETTVMLTQTLSSMITKMHTLIRKVINSFIVIVLSLFYMQDINRTMILICFFPVILIPLLQKLLFRHIGKITKDRESISSKIYAFLKSVLENIFMANIINIFSKIEKKIASYTGTYKTVLYKENIYKGIEKNLNFIITLLGICLILAIGSFQIINGKTTIPDIFAFLFAFEYFVGPVVFLTGINVSISECKGLYERVSVINNNTSGEESTDKIHVENIFSLQLEGLELRIGERIIKYPDCKFNFPANSGCIILKGENGSGKTSFLRMMMKFENDYVGKLLVNDSNLLDIDTSEWRNMLSYAPQVPIFHKDNI